jgi:hypothetical protein
MNPMEIMKGMLDTVAPIRAVKSSQEQEREVANNPRDAASL